MISRTMGRCLPFLAEGSEPLSPLLLWLLWRLERHLLFAVAVPATDVLPLERIKRYYGLFMYACRHLSSLELQLLQEDPWL